MCKLKKNFTITMKGFQENLQTITAGKKVVVWGAGSCAASFINQLGGYDGFISYYVDASETKWNTNIGNAAVKSPGELFEDSSVDIVIIATMYFASVVEELQEKWLEKALGELQVYSAFHMVFREGQLDYRPLEEHLGEIKEMLADEKSRNIVDFICRHRKVMDIDFSEICEANQYFVNDIVKIDPHAVFVDAGAYHGETVEQFISFQKGKFDKVYSFEMDANNYALLKEKDFDERVELLNFGLWDRKMECEYASDDTSSALGEGDMVAQCISLDEVIGDGNVTFIKMDIEGAEMNALLGAEKCIKRCKPQLAICVYHKPNDIYEITSLLHRWLPEHNFYIRHHGPIHVETVLYAVRGELR